MDQAEPNLPSQATTNRTKWDRACVYQALRDYNLIYKYHNTIHEFETSQAG